MKRSSLKSPTKSERKPDNMSPISQTSAIRLEESQILNCSKEAKDRLLTLHDTIKKRIDHNFSQIVDIQDEKEKLRCREIIMMLKMLMGRLQLGIYDSHLLIELCHYLQSYDLALSKCREEARKLLLENGRLRDQIESLSEQTYAKEAQLASTHEMLCYWEFLCETAAMELNSSPDDLSLHELFKISLKLTDNEMREALYDLEDPERTLYQEVRRLMAANEILQAIKYTKTYLKSSQNRRSEQLAQVLVCMFSYCMDAELFDDARETCVNAIEILIKHYNRSHVQVILVTCRIAYAFICEKRYQEASNVLIKAIEDYRSDTMQEETAMLARMYFVVGYCAYKCNCENLGLQIMEISVLAIESKLPLYEEDWSTLNVSFLKLLNMRHFYSAALYTSCDAYLYYLDAYKSVATEDRSCPIYETAFLQNNNDFICNERDIPTGRMMPSTYQEIVGEMKVAFAGLGRIAANTLLDRYIDEVKKFDLEISITEEQAKKEVARIMDKKSRQSRKSSTLSESNKMSEVKKSFKCSDTLMEFMKQSDVDNCPLEYKTASRRNKKCQNPFKLLVSLSKMALTAYSEQTKQDVKSIEGSVRRSESKRSVKKVNKK